MEPILIAGALVLVGTAGVLLFGSKSRGSQHKKRKIAKNVYKTLQGIESAPQMMAYLKKIDFFAFEELLLDAFERRGFKVIRNKRYTGDGGVDGRVIINGHTFLIQAKRYQAHINPAHVSALNELCINEQTYGIFIHTGITGPASKATHHDHIAMISGDQLVRFLTGNDTIRLLLNRKHYIEI